MRRNLELAGGAILFLAIIVGAVMYGTVDTQSPREDPGDLNATPEPNTTNNSTVTPAPPVFVPDDPGRHSYPENPSSAEEEIVGSKQVADHLFDQINYRRNESDLPPLYKTATLRSVPRTHSWDMYNRSYLSPEPRGDMTTVEQYNGTATECVEVTRYVFQEERVVETADGEPRYTSSEGIASDVFSQMLSNETMSETMLGTEHPSVGVGAYVTSEETEDGATVVVTTITVDFCSVEE